MNIFDFKCRSDYYCELCATHSTRKAFATHTYTQLFNECPFLPDQIIRLSWAHCSPEKHLGRQLHGHQVLVC